VAEIIKTQALERMLSKKLLFLYLKTQEFPKISLSKASLGAAGALSRGFSLL
jgi:hypothetical protein